MGDEIDEYDELVDTIIDIGYDVEPSHDELVQWVHDGQKSQEYVALCTFCVRELLGYDISAPFYMHLGKAMAQLDCRVDTRQLVQDLTARMMVLEYLVAEVVCHRIAETRMVASGVAPPASGSAGGATACAIPESVVRESLGTMVNTMDLAVSPNARSVLDAVLAKVAVLVGGTAMAPLLSPSDLDATQQAILTEVNKVRGGGTWWAAKGVGKGRGSAPKGRAGPPAGS